MRINASTVISWGRKLEHESATMTKARKKALRRSAAYVWRVAKNSIRKKSKKEKHVWTDPNGKKHEVMRWKASPVGGAPFDHGHGWKKTFHFEISDDGEEAVIGPIDGRRHIAPTLEFGGKTMVSWKAYEGGKKVSKNREVTIGKRPTMSLALDKSQSKLAEFWKNVIR